MEDTSLKFKNEYGGNKMSLDKKSIDNINLQDISDLIKYKIPESKNLEYKGEMHGDKEKENINKTVCGFANASGGLFIYGLEEDENKKPTEIKSISLNGTNWDEKKRSILSIIGTNIEPRVDVKIREKKISEDKVVILIKVPKSWNAPHCIKKNNGKNRSFYIRRDGSTDPMEFEEIKSMFDFSNNLQEKINSYRNERFSFWNSKINDNYKVIFHAVPFDSFSKSRIDLKKARVALRNKQFLGGFYSSDFEGLYSSSRYPFKIRLFRNGIFEAIRDEDKGDVYVDNFKERFEEFVNGCLELYEELDILCPVVFFVTFTNVKGRKIAKGPLNLSMLQDAERDTLDPAGVIIEDKNQVGSEVHNLFVPIYNHFGIECDYDFEQSEN